MSVLQIVIARLAHVKIGGNNGLERDTCSVSIICSRGYDNNIGGDVMTQIGHDQEAIFRNSTINMHKQCGTEGVLTCLIEMIESAQVIADKLGELVEKDELLVSKHMKLLHDYNAIVLPTLIVMRDKLTKDREKPENGPPFGEVKFTDEDISEGIGDE